MKKKSKHAIAKKRREFRYHGVVVKKPDKKKITIRHPSYVFLQKGNVLFYVTITHSKNVDGQILLELKKNPNPVDKRKAYWVVKIKEDTIDSFGKILKKWFIDNEDDDAIRSEYNCIKGKK